MDEGLGELDPLLHPGGVSLDVTVAGFTESAILEDFVSSAECLVARESGKFSCVGHKADPAEAGEVAILFGHVADAPPDLAPFAGDIGSHDGAGPLSGIDKS